MEILTSKRNTSENRSAVLFAVLWIMWQEQPFTNIILFLANTRVMMEFFFPTFPHRCVFQPNSNTVFPIYPVFS